MFPINIIIFYVLSLHPKCVVVTRLSQLNNTRPHIYFMLTGVSLLFSHCFFPSTYCLFYLYFCDRLHSGVSPSADVG